MEKFIISILAAVFYLVLFVICELVFKINFIWIFILWFVISLILYCWEYSVRRKYNNKYFNNN